MTVFKEKNVVSIYEVRMHEIRVKVLQTLSHYFMFALRLPQSNTNNSKLLNACTDEVTDKLLIHRNSTAMEDTSIATKRHRVEVDEPLVTNATDIPNVASNSGAIDASDSAVEKCPHHTVLNPMDVLWLFAPVPIHPLFVNLHLKSGKPYEG